jgi:glycosyltransferase involved in cell wall biosynthesis
LARIHPHKKLEDLLMALRLAHPHLPPWRLLIAGGADPGCDDYDQHLKNLAMDLPVDWLGGVTDLTSFFRNLDLFVVVAEPAGCPNASLEAMAAGLPVLATAGGGIAEQVVEGITGRIVPARHPEVMAQALIELVHEPSRLSVMARAARQHVETKFSLDRMVSDYLQLIAPKQDPELSPERRDTGDGLYRTIAKENSFWQPV